MAEEKAIKVSPLGSRLKVKGVKRNNDTSLAWVDREYPQLSTWRALAVEWLKGEMHGVGDKLDAMVVFFERYLIQQALPLNPAEFFARDTVLPEFYRTVCPQAKKGIEYNNYIHSFLYFVLLREFSKADENGQPIVSPAFHNPVLRVSKGGIPKRDESIYSPLPYGYIDELRQMLAAGPNFQDWKWAQTGLGAGTGRRGHCVPGWFEVTEEQIDRSDPDCVLRESSLSKNGVRFEMWSPVRWVALLVKLILPLCTFQVRMLDSGEADTWHFATGNWTLNSSRLAQGSERNPLQQGIFRRNTLVVDGEAGPAVLYINTNKTADIAKSASEKGYLLPWPVGGPLHQDVFYWLEKLRNCQEKYNSIARRIDWRELDGRYIKAKSEVQLASYPETCFLFRMPEAGDDERHLPLKELTLFPAWFCLLAALEQRLAKRGETHRNGAPILFLPPKHEQNKGLTTLFPLHSLRVSLITALALEGQVPFPILQKLVGHSRLLMTLYYTKPGASHVRDLLLGAVERLEANKEASIQNFLLNTEYDELLQKAICNSISGLAAAIPLHPAVRNPVGWMAMHHGLCLVGGNTGEADDNGAVGGCYNGGSNLGSTSTPRHGPVPGGSRNCVRCRWFMTEPHHLPALVAHFNTLAYHFDEARNACLARESELQALKKQKFDTEVEGQPFAQMGAYRQAQRVWESTMKRFSELAEDLVACWRLIERCKAALEELQGGGSQLIAAGTVGDVHVAFEETESELLQLAGVCDNVEVYPDLEPGKAVFRRSQLLDAVLYRENLSPVFLLLSEREQLLAGNAFLRHLAQQMNPANPALGQRDVIRLIDAGVKLSHNFDMDLTSLLSMQNHIRPFRVRRQAVRVEDEA